MDVTLCVGQRAGRQREALGLTRGEVAEAVGRSPDWLRAAEAGRQRIDRQAMVDALADALGVSPGELLGVPCGREDGVAGPVHRALPGLRRALLRSGLPVPATADPPPIEALRRRLAAASRLRDSAAWADLALKLPALLDDLRGATAHDPTGVEPAGLLADALHETSLLVKRLGAYDLAALAAAEVRHLAAALDDPARSASALWLQAELALCTGAVAEASGCLEAGLASTDALLGRADPQVWAVWGTLHLVAAVLEGGRGLQAQSSAHLAEAAAALAHTDPVTAGRTGFGVGEWAVHTVHAALELGEDLGALARIEGVDLSGLPAARRARHGIDRARAQFRAGEVTAGLGELLAADRAGAAVVRTHPLVGELLRTAPGRTVAPTAERLGVRL
ncbi:helix-turn-helix domain-containing protein [Kitasatospora paracochleata]|uniref:helix-turn-helix domain-containing protein n=1 Tax=Kitasatospora paracochleata TaxID=58354 RepID=UPI0020A28265|nr:helix-turn-helix transcriptional regulator [Kitasatospora paracochleata]